ncbi:Flp family type IVb pilin [Candidatus Sodalis endolongispinus]|uniref:Flp family type IVb pilin n=1 Tax=Candidatus Sodalis endolongispinus TaxID=2812662 RepID=A0ABS5YEI4_9GAMM|nr:Flp family type IVb pilin [Candidatus Sodalis endolongispinus]MBT9433441.1 Flp family type IVb pilin [Candidatus Sodalis endolongispinus]
MLSATKAKKYYPGFTTRCRQFFKDQRGVTTIEYAMLGVGMAVLIVAITGKDSTFNKKMVEAYTDVATKISEATAKITLSK